MCPYYFILKIISCSHGNDPARLDEIPRCMGRVWEKWGENLPYELVIRRTELGIFCRFKPLLVSDVVFCKVVEVSSTLISSDR